MMSRLHEVTEIIPEKLVDTPETILLRKRMVETQLRTKCIVDQRILSQMEAVPRHWFCLPGTPSEHAYGDYPLPVGWGATISQPWMVAYMLEALNLTGDEVVLEIGTGSGYNAALLSGLARSVISLEIVPELAMRSQQLLQYIGYHNVTVHQSDGSIGWSSSSPYDAIIVTAGAPDIPESLARQLRIGGRLVIPAGNRELQQLQLAEKTSSGLTLTLLSGCRFVPLLGQEGWDNQ